VISAICSFIVFGSRVSMLSIRMSTCHFRSSYIFFDCLMKTLVKNRDRKWNGKVNIGSCRGAL
jgi:hypothetical protein